MSNASRMLDVAFFATQGTGSGDEQRIAHLLAPLSPQRWPFDRDDKRRSASDIRARIRTERPDLVVMEGTGMAGGLPLLASGVPFVFSSGDAVGPYLGLHGWGSRIAGEMYERALYQRCAGFIGWSPYLVGRAISLGARRAITAAGWADPVSSSDALAVRESLGIGAGDLVVGIVGSLDWTASVGYCYGFELAQAAAAVSRDDLVMLIVGDGSGLTRVRHAARHAACRVITPGRIPRDRVPSILSAMDVASLPQSIDAVGALRLTTKLSEYVAAGLPVITGQLPLAYDYDTGWLWRLPGDAPWDPRYVSALAELLNHLPRSEVRRRAEAVPPRIPEFDKLAQQSRVCAFIEDLISFGRAVA